MSLWNGAFLMMRSVLFWYFLISLNATVPGRYRWGFLTAPAVGAVSLAAFVASSFLGAFPPVDLRADCFVRAMFVVGLRRFGVDVFL